MTAPYQVNLSIEAGTDFIQQFYITGPNLAPMDITGNTFNARIAKHPTAINALTSTTATPVYEYVPFTTAVVNGAGGCYSISLTAAQTALLNEGKYVYNVVMVDANSITTSVLSGLIFVDVAFGSGSFVLPT